MSPSHHILKTWDRRWRRAVAGALLGALPGGCAGAITGALLICPMLGPKQNGLWEAALITAIPGAVGGLLVGGAGVLIRDDRNRPWWCAYIGAVFGLLLGSWIGYRLCFLNFGPSDPVTPDMVASSVWHYSTRLGLAGTIAGWLVGLVAGFARRRWSWLTRWDEPLAG